MIFLNSILMILKGWIINYSTRDLFFPVSGEKPFLDEINGETQIVRGEREFKDR